MINLSFKVNVQSAKPRVVKRSCSFRRSKHLKITIQRPAYFFCLFTQVLYFPFSSFSFHYFLILSALFSCLISTAVHQYTRTPALKNGCKFARRFFFINTSSSLHKHIYCPVVCSINVLNAQRVLVNQDLVIQVA